VPEIKVLAIEPDDANAAGYMRSIFGDGIGFGHG
jgi:hypothetical protein